MPTNSLDKHTAWFTTRLDWPIERVQIEVDVVSPRKLHVLEWAVLRLIDDPEVEAPSMIEAAALLGVGDSVFLSESANNLAEVGAIETTLEQPTELADWSLTDLGRTLLRDGKATTLPECHGLAIYFDAITGNPIPSVPRNLRDTAANPVVHPEELRLGRDHIGVDFLRDLAEGMYVPFLTRTFRSLSC